MQWKLLGNCRKVWKIRDDNGGILHGEDVGIIPGKGM